MKLDGSWLYNGYRDYREGQCHNLNPNSLSVKSKTIQPGVPLRVATEEHDNWPNSNGYWSADIPSDKCMILRVHHMKSRLQRNILVERRCHHAFGLG